MSNASPPFDFSQFVPGFDFLKNLAGAATGASAPAAGGIPGLPSLSSWIAPTVSVEEVDKRIQELKTVQYWLEQNGHALKATIQALEVQKMTLSTLRGMNVRMEDLANAFTRHANVASGAAAEPEVQPAPAIPAMPLAGFFGRMADALQPSSPATEEAAAPEAPRGAIPPGPRASDPVGGRSDERSGEESDQKSGPSSDESPAKAGADGRTAPAGVVDPMQWWGAITQQFQQIAESAMKEAAQIQMPQMPQMPSMPSVDKPAPGRKSGAGGASRGKSASAAPSAAPAKRAASAARKGASGTGAARRPATGKTPASRKSAAPRRPRG
jgi:hypothetical protein